MTCRRGCFGWSSFGRSRCRWSRRLCFRRSLWWRRLLWAPGSLRRSFRLLALWRLRAFRRIWFFGLVRHSLSDSPFLTVRCSYCTNTKITKAEDGSKLPDVELARFLNALLLAQREKCCQSRAWSSNRADRTCIKKSILKLFNFGGRLSKRVRDHPGYG